jgi:O-Antigen ligase
MGRSARRRAAVKDTTASVAPPVDPGRRPELLRRFLLAVVVALLVARPFVLGEDPGFLLGLSSSAGLFLTMAWILTALGAAAWRLWSGLPGPRVHPVEWGLASLAALSFLATNVAAHYRFPGWLISWEWVVFLLVFALVRRLARTPAERRQLLAAMVASAAALGVYAVYQYTVEMPRDRATLSDPENLRREVAKLGVHFEGNDDPRLRGWIDRVQQKNVFGTYAHPNSFAGFMALMLPAGLGWAVVCRLREKRWTWRACTAALAAAALLAGLWLTHSRGAIIGSLLALLLLAPMAWGSLLAHHRKWIAGAAALLMVAVLVAALTPIGANGLQKARASLGLRGDYWTATAAMIRDHVFWGVGPGNFGRHYHQYMLPTAHEEIQDPHNFILETWVASGLLAVLALGATLAAFYLAWARGVGAAEVEAAEADPQPRWDFYAAGGTGLIVAYLLRAGETGGAGILAESALSVGRAVVWFVVFAVLAPNPWPGARRALGMGITALLFNLLISGGISQPSVAQPLWALAALALPAAELCPIDRVRAGCYVMAAVLLTAVYGLWTYQPVLEVDGQLAEARRYYGDNPDQPGWNDRVRDGLEAAAKNPVLTDRILHEADQYLKQHILLPLQQAAAAAPGDVAPARELARWYYQEWVLLFPDTDDLAQKAVQEARRMQKLDPDNPESYLREYDLQMARAKRFPKSEKEHLRAARQALETAVQRDPTKAKLHFELAELQFNLGDTEAGKKEAARAIELNDLSTEPNRKLQDAQLLKARERVGQ